MIILHREGAKKLTWAASLLALHCACLAQQPAQDKPFEIQADVNRVLVEVVVHDKQGHAVENLRKEEFQILDNGKPRGVSSFQVEKHGVQTAAVAGGEVAHGTEQSPPQTQTPAPDGMRFILFVFDDLHLSMEDLAHAKASANKMLDESLTPTDMAAVVSLSGSINSGLTRDHMVLQETIGKLTPRAIYQMKGSECPDIGYYQADQIQSKHDSVALQAAVQMVFNCAPGMDRQRDYELAQRTAEAAAMRVVTRGEAEIHGTYSALAAYVKAMNKLPQGERLMVLVSSGFLAITQEAINEESRLIDAAAQANVTISALDARGLYTTNLDASTASLGSAGAARMQEEMKRNSATSSENPMAELANGTGGSFFHNSNDLLAGFRGLTETPTCVYLLELPLDGVKADGSYHRLKVKLDRRDVDVRARSGYFVPKAGKTKK